MNTRSLQKEKFKTNYFVKFCPQFNLKQNQNTTILIGLLLVKVLKTILNY